MGSALDPVLANLFMGYHKKKWLEEFDKGKFLMCKRYVHDIFCMFGNEKDAENFFGFLNCCHKNITFTIEKESNKYCHFLIFLSTMKETVFQHQFIERKHQLGYLHSFIVLYQ